MSSMRSQVRCAVPYRRQLMRVHAITGAVACAGVLLPGLCCAAGRAQAAVGADPQPHQGNRCCCLTGCPTFFRSLAAVLSTFAALSAVCTCSQQRLDALRFAAQFGHQKMCCAKVDHFCSLHHSVLPDTGWEAVMRVRCSRGLRVSTFHGPMFVRSTDLLALPQVNSQHVGSWAVHLHCTACA